MNRLAIIPARGGSKRLPRKNLLKLGDKPLVQHTIDAVVGSNCFTKIILSSDDEAILRIGESIEGVTCERREDSLSGDKVKVIDLVKQIAARDGYDQQFEQIGLFLPTCPFRSAADIAAGIELLTRDDYGVVSVNELRDPIQLTLTVDPQTRLIDPEAVLRPSPLVTGETRSQDFQPYFRVNGGFYIAWLDKFIVGGNFFKGPVKAYQMESIRAVDIDHQSDFDYANLLIENGYI